MRRGAMKRPDLSAYRVLIVPGLHNSGPGHWQSRWEKLYPDAERVEQDDWEQPDLLRWSRRLDEVLNRSTQPTIVIAHSFGCLASVHAASCDRHNLTCALLVAPADPDKFGVAEKLLDARLPCPSIVVGSSNDPWMASKRAAYWADSWGSGFLNGGPLGHINADSNLGVWKSGLQQLSLLLRLSDAFATSVSSSDAE
jgi:predicted alpha/beta hydrolase family esterase